MPAATNKADLLAVSEKEYAKLLKLIEGISDSQAMKKRAEDTSIKDVVGHRAHWIKLFLGWYAAGQDGDKVAIPAPGYKWNQLKEYNAQLRADQSDLTWPDAKRMLAKNHEVLLVFLEEKDETVLYGDPMPGGESKWTTGRWAEAAGPSHYRSAAKWIRACLKADRA